MLMNTDVNSIEELGPAIRRALTHPSIRGKFDGVSLLLKQFGYSRVVVADAGLMFISLKDGKIRILVESSTMFVSDDHEMMMVAVQVTLSDDDEDEFINFPTEEDIVKEKKMKMRSKINGLLKSMFYIRKNFHQSIIYQV